MLICKYRFPNELLLHTFMSICFTQSYTKTNLQRLRLLASKHSHSWLEMLGRDVTADEIIFIALHARQRGVAGAFHARDVQPDCDVLERRPLHLVDGGGVAGTDGEVRGTLVFWVWVRPSPHRQPLIGLCAHDQRSRLIRFDRRLHAIHEIVLLVAVVGEEDAHAFIDLHGLGDGLAVRAKLAVLVVVLLVRIEMPRKFHQDLMVRSMEDFSHHHVVHLRGGPAGARDDGGLSLRPLE